MDSPNIDLLPPLFDQVLKHYGRLSPGPYTRADIVKAVENGIVNAVAKGERAKARLPGYNKPTTDFFKLLTNDRLSGLHISRASLSSEIQQTLSLSSQVVEMALLMIEAQIDLRLRAARSFSLAGIEFALENHNGESTQEQDITDWCKRVLPLALQGATSDAPTIWNRMRGYRPEGLRILVENLQLTASLREAVPYEISVAARLVAPLLVDEPEDERIRLLHISDLHFVEDLADPKRGGSPTLGQAKHSFQAARLLGRAVDALQPSYHIVAATGTGDLTTDGAQGSFETVLQYIQSGPISGENKMRIATFGLNAGRGNRILVPGNHDRFAGEWIPGQRLSYTFETALGTPIEYPYVKGFRPPGRDSSSLTLLLFVLDSNLPAGKEVGSEKAWIDGLSKGTISDEEITQLGKVAQDASQNKKVENLDGDEIDFDPGNTIRIALLHHHPVAELNAENAAKRRKKISTLSKVLHPMNTIRDRALAISESAMKLDGAKAFLEQCACSGIQLILFGHQHLPYRRVIRVNGSGDSGEDAQYLRAYCCPTTLEKTEHGNGFYIFDFHDKHTVTIDFYVSALDRKRASLSFNRVSAKSGQFDLCRLHPQESGFLYNLQKSKIERRLASWGS